VACTFLDVAATAMDEDPINIPTDKATIIFFIFMGIIIS
jgi:hypothetical protein